MSKRQIASRITTPAGVFQAGKEVAIIARVEGKEKATAGTIDQLYADGTCVIKCPAGMSEFQTQLFDLVEARIGNLVLREEMAPAAWDGLFPKPPEPTTPKENDVRRRSRQQTVMTITETKTFVRFCPSAHVKGFVEALKAQTRSRSWNAGLMAWNVAPDEREIAERLALEHFDKVLLVNESGEMRQLKPYPWQVKHQRG